MPFDNMSIEKGEPYNDPSLAESAERQDSIGDVEPPQMSRLNWIALIIAVLCAPFLFALDNTIVAAIQPRILQDLGHVENLAWISVAFNLGAASANLCWGKLYSFFEHKRLFISAMVLFEIGSAVCGAAPNMNALIIGRVLCGLGGNGLYIGTMNILSNLTTIKERPLYLAFFGVVWGVGVVLGPVIGGAFTSNPHAGWRWSFYINICVAVAVMPVYLLILRTHHPQPGFRVRDRVKGLDFLGAMLYVGAYTTIVMAISFGGATYAWDSARTIALFCVSGVLWISFVIQQAYCIMTTPNLRLFPAHLLHSWENWILFAQTAASITVLFLPVYFIPLYYQFVHDDTPLQASIRLLPYICVAVFFCLLNGGLMGALGYYMPWYFGGAALVIVGAALMRIVDPGTSNGNIYGFSVILAAGVGSFVQAGFPVAQARNAASEKANVLAFMGCAQLSGLAVGFSVSNAVLVNQATQAVANVLPHASRADVQAAITGSGAQLFHSLSSVEKQAILAGLATSIDKVYDGILASGCFCLVLALFMKREKLFMG